MLRFLNLNKLLIKRDSKPENKLDNKKEAVIKTHLPIRFVNSGGSYGKVIMTLPYTIRPVYVDKK